MKNHSDNNQHERSLWHNTVRYFNNQGFPGPLCSRVRVTAYGCGRLGAERRYRFRWQKLYARGRAFRWVRATPRRRLWMNLIGFQEARLPDTGQLNDAIGRANKAALISKWTRESNESWVLDSARDPDKEFDSETDSHVIDETG